MLRAPLVVLASVAMLVAACDPAVSPAPPGSPSASPSASGPTPDPTSSDGPSASQDTAAIYRSIEADVIELRGLEPEQDVEPRLLSEAEIRERTATSFRKDNPPELVRANEVLLRALGLLDEDASLTDLYVELLGSQVAGFYDPDTDELYVVARSGSLGPSERVTFAHEFTHALQDQHFDLKSFGLDEIGQGDRSIARLSLIEGDATAVMTFWAQTGLTPEETVRLVRESLDPEALAILERMPPILRESLEFPYSQGLQLVLRIQASGGWDAVNEAFSAPPASTEQVLHPEKYDAREAPVAVDLPADLATGMGSGWKVTLEDTFGEFQTQVWLRNALRRIGPGNEAAAGWGGDRLAVLEGPDATWALLWDTTWDSDRDAAEFESAASDALETTGSAYTLDAGGRSVLIAVASDHGVLERAMRAVGRTGP